MRAKNLPTLLMLMRLGAVVLTALLLTPVWGCKISGRNFKIVITDFDTARVEGIWLYHESEPGAGFVRDTEIRLGDTFTQGGVELVDYVMIDSITQHEFAFAAQVVRSERNPDAARLNLFALLWAENGSFKASTYNEFGESDLSVETLEVSL